MHSYKLHLDVQEISGQRGWWDDNADDDYDADDDGWRDPTSWDLYRSDALPAENVVVCAKSQTKNPHSSPNLQPKLPGFTPMTLVKMK